MRMNLKARIMKIDHVALYCLNLEGMRKFFIRYFHGVSNGMFKTTLPVSFQFHHVQMDGGHAARFLDILQDEIESCILGSSL